MKIYVAGRTTDVRNVQRIADAVEDEGHEITFKWWGEEGEIRTDLKSEDLELLDDSPIGAGVVEVEGWQTVVRHNPTGECATGTGFSKVAAHDAAVNKLRATLNAGWHAAPERARELAERERKAVWDADLVVLVWAPDLLGAAIEVGIALGEEKPVYVYRSGRDSVFWYLPGCKQVNSQVELLDAIGEEAKLDDEIIKEI